MEFLVVLALTAARLVSDGLAVCCVLASTACNAAAAVPRGGNTHSKDDFLTCQGQRDISRGSQYGLYVNVSRIKSAPDSC